MCVDRPLVAESRCQTQQLRTDSADLVTREIHPDERRRRMRGVLDKTLESPCEVLSARSSDELACTQGELGGA